MYVRTSKVSSVEMMKRKMSPFCPSFCYHGDMHRVM